MPTFTFTYGSSRAILAVDINAITNDPANNRTLVRLTGRIYDGNASLGGFGTGSWNIGLDGVERGAGSFRYDFTGNSGRTYTFYNADEWITHNANGSRSISVYTNFNGFTSLIGGGSASGSLTLTDYDRSPVFGTITTPSPTIRGVAYTGSFTATNMPATNGYSISAGALPTGLSLNVNTGAITGTPTVAGSYTFTVRATGAFEGTPTAERTIVVNPPAPVFSDLTLASEATVGTAYSDAVAASDAGYGIVSPTTAYSILSGSLPAGLSLNTSTGAITGTPTTAGTSNFVINATNVTGSTRAPASPNTFTIITAVAGGNRVWNGTSFVLGKTRIWNGTSFVEKIPKIWNGSAWVDAK